MLYLIISLGLLNIYYNNIQILSTNCEPFIFYKKILNSDKYNKIQPKTCQELWKRCRILCSTINPLDRIKYHANGCCIMSPIPNTGSFQPLFEPLFSNRTSFSYYQNIVEVVIIKRTVKCYCFIDLFPRIKDVHV